MSVLPIVAIVISFASLLISFVLIFRQVVIIPETNNKMRYFTKILLILDELEKLILKYPDDDKIYYIETLLSSKNKQIRTLLKKADEIQKIRYHENHKFKDQHENFLKLNSTYEILAGKLYDKNIPEDKKSKFKLYILQKIIASEIYIENIIYERKVKQL